MEIWSGPPDHMEPFAGSGTGSLDGSGFTSSNSAINTLTIDPETGTFMTFPIEITASGNSSRGILYLLRQP